jgi:predicted nucleotidyltransferase
MDLPENWCEEIRRWATRTSSVREVWLFGSRAKGTHRPHSDIDIAIYLMPPNRTGDWALAKYTACGDAWQRELSAALGRHVSLEAVTFGTDTEVRSTGRLLWVRA